ncbi:MAG: hypothetical protein FWG85_05250 [Bacteroidetes bacterium]|nr:hypothetical protein [Bacteroidota bacterium]
MNNKLMETDRRKKSDGEATAIVKMFADLQPVLLFILTLVFSIILLASCKDDVIQTNTNTNPLVGEWYEVFLDTNTIVTTQVVFTETHVTAWFDTTEYYKDIPFLDNPYKIVEDNKIQISDLPSKDSLGYPTSWSGSIDENGIYTTEFTFRNDTLWIKRFIPYIFFGQIGPIYLLKRSNKIK